MGSNSARVVVFRKAAGGVLEVIADQHISLQLIRELDRNRRLPKAAIDRSIRVLRDFRRVADAAGAQRILAFGTAAMREAANGDEFRERAARESGVKMQIMAPAAEAHAGFLGAVYGLPVTSGIVFDIGGGSLQITQFRDRREKKACSLPLGALRISDEFLSSDPPSTRQVRKLRAYVAGAMAGAEVPRLKAGESVVGTGGAVRTLAKVDSRRWAYPIPRLHGYELTKSRLRELTAMLLSRTVEERAEISGLKAARADSIVGGALVAEAVLEASKSSRFFVAGQGLREGVVLDGLLERLPKVERVREHSVAVLASRFSSCEAARAARRRTIALSLYDCLEPYPDPILREMLAHAAAVVDVGRSIDYYRMHSHAAEIVRESAPLGFGHREVALLSSIVEIADRDGWDPNRAAPPLAEDDFDALERAGVLLALAEAIESRRLPGRPSPAAGGVRGRSFVVEEPGLEAWDDPVLAARFRKAFGKELRSG